jgi:hypothetical protein
MAITTRSTSKQHENQNQNQNQGQKQKQRQKRETKKKERRENKRAMRLLDNLRELQGVSKAAEQQAGAARLQDQH